MSGPGRFTSLARALHELLLSLGYLEGLRLGAGEGEVTGRQLMPAINRLERARRHLEAALIETERAHLLDHLSPPLPTLEPREPRGW